MKNKKKIVRILAIFISLVAVSGWFGQPLAKEGDYPTKEISMYIGFPPGGAADTSGRVVCKIMEKILGQPVVPINKDGGSSAIATAFVANAKSDGYTLLYGLSPYAAQKKIEDPSLPYSVEKLTFFGASHKAYVFLTVKSDSPWKTYEQFVDFVKKNPVKFGSLGVGSLEGAVQVHFAEFVGFKKMIQIPYAGGGKSVPALLAGEVEAVTHAGPAVPYVKSGDFRWLVFLGPERNSLFPDIPAITEKENGFDTFFPVRNFLAGPKGLPAPVVDKLTKAFKQASEAKEVHDIFARMTYVPEYLTPQKCAEVWRGEEKLYAEIFKKAKKEK